jgi:DNA uptake protein ComE-like DNA-binding protein
MKSHYAVTGALLTACLLGGCVSTGKYNEVVSEKDATMTELERTRSQKTALEQQVKTLKELNVKFSNEAQAARDELQRIEHGRDKERSSVDAHTKELEQKVAQLSAQQRSLRHNETLKSLVARYQKELKDRSPVPVPGSVQPPSLSLPGAPVPGPSAAIPPGLGAKAAPSGLPSLGAGAPLNLNKATAGEMVEQLGVTKDVAEKIVSHRPYRLKGELVAKNVVPKETYDVIKDRVTVSP